MYSMNKRHLSRSNNSRPKRSCKLHLMCVVECNLNQISGEGDISTNKFEYCSSTQIHKSNIKVTPTITPKIIETAPGFLQIEYGLYFQESLPKK